MGSLYRLRYAPEGQTYAEAKSAGTLREAAVWWVKYRANGRIIRESTGTSSRLDASRILKRKEGRAAEGKPVAPRADKVTLRDLAEGLKADYQANARKSLDRLRLSLDHLLRFFGDRKANSVGTADVRAYIVARQGEGAANGTINRELAALKRAFSLALQDERLYHRPHIPMLQEAAPRSGFFEREQFTAICRHLPDYVVPVAEFMNETGWRTKEVLGLEWRQVDLKVGTVRLDPGSTKNDDGRVVYMTPTLRRVLEAQKASTEAVQRERGTIIPWVFNHHGGRPLRDFRKSWRTARRLAGCPDRRPHDFRRTVVRNLERAGVSRSVATKTTGHKTEAVYRRYAIVSDGDLREAAAKLGHSALDSAHHFASGSHGPR